MSKFLSFFFFLNLCVVFTFPGRLGIRKGSREGKGMQGKGQGIGKGSREGKGMQGKGQGIRKGSREGKGMQGKGKGTGNRKGK